MRKQFQTGANVPMVTETHRRLALELRLAGEALIGAPSVDTYNQLSKMLAALNYAGMAGEALDLATETMSAICDRYARVQRIGVSEPEAAALRLAIDSIDAQLPRIPLNRFAASVAQVEIFCADAGA